MLLNQHSAAIAALVNELGRTAGIATSPEAVVHWLRGQLTPNMAVVPAPLPPTPSYQPSAPARRIGGPHYWLMPCGFGEDGTEPLDQLRRWLAKGFWGIRKSAPGRRHLQPGDYACFYVRGLGVAATARIARLADTLVGPEEWSSSQPGTGEVYKVPLKDILWLPEPRAITAEVCAQLHWWQGSSREATFGWLVQTTRSLTPGDFEVLTAGTQVA